MRKEYENFIDELFDELISLTEIQQNNLSSSKETDLFLEDKNGDLYIEILCPGINKDSLKIDTIENGLSITYDQVVMTLDKEKNLTEKTNKVNKKLISSTIKTIKEVVVKYRDGIITLKFIKEKKDNKIKISGL